MLPKKQRIIDIFGRDPQTMDELAQCVIAVHNATGGNTLIGFKWIITHCDVSNSHSAPEGKATNWSRKDNEPKSYPGWYGRVWVRYASPYRGFISHVMPDTLTHIGAGGCGHYDGPFQRIHDAYYQKHGHRKSISCPEVFSWDYRIYDMDWPAATEIISQQNMYDKIAGRPTKSHQHIYEWHDPATLIADTEFMEDWSTIKENIKHEKSHI